jgi:hypothetical protein
MEAHRAITNLVNLAIADGLAFGLHALPRQSRWVLLYRVVRLAAGTALDLRALLLLLLLLALAATIDGSWDLKAEAHLPGALPHA